VKELGRVFVVKEPNIDKSNKKACEDEMYKMYYEFILMRKLNGNPHIIDYRYFMRRKDKETGCEDSFLVFDYIPCGDLQEYIKANHFNFTVDKIKFFTC